MAREVTSVAQQLSVRLRRVLYQVHLWIAVTLCLLLVPIGLTGSLIAWPEQINGVLHRAPEVAHGASPTLPPSAYLTRAQAGLPKGARLLALRMPAKGGDAVVVTATMGRGGPAAGRTAWLDPADGRVLQVGRTISPVFQIFHEFHDKLLMEDVGGPVVGWAGVGMFILSLSGIWLWWPRGNGFLRAFRWRRTPGTLLNLHYLVGFWISIPLAVVSLTGVFISFPKAGAAVFGAPPPQQAQAPAPAGRGGGGPPPRPNLTAEQAIDAARSSHPEAQRLVSIALPPPNARGPAAGAWRVELAGGGPPLALRVDDRTSAVSAAPAAGPPAPTSGVGLNRFIHEGRGSLLWKWIVTVTGLVPAFLAITGLITWIRAELRKARSRRAGAPDEAASQA